MRDLFHIFKTYIYCKSFLFLNKPILINTDYFQVQSVDKVNHSTTIIDKANTKFVLPFKIEENTRSIELQKILNKENVWEFSLLIDPKNCYVLNNKYEFKIIELFSKHEGDSERWVLKVMDKFDSIFYIYTRKKDFINLKGGDMVTCKVKKIYPHKIFFNYQRNEVPYFKNDGTYKFETVNSYPTKNRNDLAILIIKYRDLFFEITIPIWQHYNLKSYPFVNCEVSENGEKISQIYNELQHPFFVIGKIYSFQILEHPENKKNFLLVLGEDNCEYSVIRPFIISINSLEKGDVVKLVFKGLTKDYGSLITKFFVPFEYIIRDFRALKRITFDAFRKELKDEESKDSSETEFLKKLYDDYDNFENLWVISFCEVLRDKIKITLLGRDFEEALIFIDVLIKVEEWILNSGFLTTFKSETRSKTTKVASQEIVNLRRESKALELLLDHNEKEFLNEFITSLKSKATNEGIVENTFVLFFLIKHQFIESPILNENQLLEFIQLIGKNGIFEQQISLFELVNYEIDKIRVLFEKKLFHHVFINSEKKNLYYTQNSKLFLYIKFTFYALLIQLAFKVSKNFKPLLLRFLRLKGLFIADKNEQKKIFSKALNSLTVNEEDFLKFIPCLPDWSYSDEDILNWEINVPPSKPLRNISSLQSSMDTKTAVSTRVIGNSDIGYELSYKEDTVFLPFHSSYRKFKKGEIVNCFISNINHSFNQVLARTVIDKTKIPDNQQFVLGNNIKGIIKSIESFGAFVFLGKHEGLIPKREVSVNFVHNIEDVLNIGDSVQAEIISLESEGDILKIGLSRRRVIESVNKTIRLNRQVYSGYITSISETFGIFLELDNGTNGLVRRDEISWNGYTDISTTYNVGDKISFFFLHSVGVNNYFSLKRITNDPFVYKFDISKPFRARITGLLTMDKWLEIFEFNFKIVADDIMKVCYCPFCYGKSPYRDSSVVNLTSVRTLQKLNTNKYWSCTNCKFHHQEEIEFFIPSIHVQARWPIRDINQKEYNKLLRRIGKSDEIDLVIKKVIISKGQLTVNPIFSTIRKGILESELRFLGKNICFEIANNYEAIGFLEENLNKKIENLEWAKSYYGASKSAKSYYFSIYISYIKILNSIIIDGNFQNIETYLVNIRSVISNVELVSNFIENFPLIETIITLLKILMQFGSNNEEALSFLLKTSLDDTLGHDYIKELASNILSYNLQLEKSNPLILESLKSSILFILENSLNNFDKYEFDNTSIEQKVFIKKLIEKGEKPNVEFKASLQVPVLNKETKKLIREKKDLLAKVSDSTQNLELKEEIIRLEKINITDKLILEKVNFNVIKTIAAFANTSGGYLLIGVDEDPDGLPIITGLTPDYTKFKNQDDLRLRIDQLIDKYFGNSFNTVLIKSIDFLNIDGKEIMVININKSLQPIFLNQQSEKKFYIRRQASSIELSVYEMYQYINNYSKN